MEKRKGTSAVARMWEQSFSLCPRHQHPRMCNGGLGQPQLAPVAYTCGCPLVWPEEVKYIRMGDRVVAVNEKTMAMLDTIMKKLEIDLSEAVTRAINHCHEEWKAGRLVAFDVHLVESERQSEGKDK